MKLRSIAIAGALTLAALSGAACSGCTYLDPNHSVTENTKLDEQALWSVQAGFFGAQTAAEASVDAGLLKTGSREAVQVADILAQLKDASVLAQAAYAAGDAKTYAAKISTAQGLIAAVWPLIPKKVV